MLVPIPTTPGLISAWVGVDQIVARMEAPGRVERLFLRRTDHGPAETATVELRALPGGAGSALTATFAAGAETAVAVGALDVTEYVYQRVTASGALGSNLGGHFELHASLPVQSLLTSLARVKAHAGIAGSSQDALLTDLILGVSQGLQVACGRRIYAQAYTAKMSGNGESPYLILPERCADAASLVVSESGVGLVLGTDFELHEDAHRLVRLKAGAPSAWLRGERNVSVAFDAGWSAVPEDLALAATVQVRHEYAQTQPSGADRLGLTSKILEGGGQANYAEHRWLPMVRDTIARYQRRWY